MPDPVVPPGSRASAWAHTAPDETSDRLQTSLERGVRPAGTGEPIPKRHRGATNPALSPLSPPRRVGVAGTPAAPPRDPSRPIPGFILLERARHLTPMQGDPSERASVHPAVSHAVSLLHPALAAKAHLAMDLTGLTPEAENGKNIYHPTKERPDYYVYEWAVSATSDGPTSAIKEFPDDEIDYRAKSINLHKTCQSHGVNVAAIEQLQVLKDGDALLFRVKVKSLNNAIPCHKAESFPEQVSMFGAAFETLKNLHAHDMFHGDTDLSNFLMQRDAGQPKSEKFKAYLIDLDTLGRETNAPPVSDPDFPASKRHDVRQLGAEVANQIDTRLRKFSEDGNATERSLLKNAEQFFGQVADAELRPNVTADEVLTYLKTFEKQYNGLGKTDT